MDRVSTLSLHKCLKWMSLAPLGMPVRKNINRLIHLPSSIALYDSVADTSKICSPCHSTEHNREMALLKHTDDNYEIGIKDSIGECNLSNLSAINIYIIPLAPMQIVAYIPLRIPCLPLGQTAPFHGKQSTRRHSAGNLPQFYPHTPNHHPPNTCDPHPVFSAHR